MPSYFRCVALHRSHNSKVQTMARAMCVQCLRVYSENTYFRIHMLYSINWPNFIVCLSLLLEILSYMCITIVYFPVCDVVNLEINLIEINQKLTQAREWLVDSCGLSLFPIKILLCSKCIYYCLQLLSNFVLLSLLSWVLLLFYFSLKQLRL